MRIDLSLRQLEAVLRIAETGSFRAAARQLGTSQPALSRLVQLAEQAIGARLFDRDTRHVAPTPAGQEVLHIARRLLSDFDNAFSDLSHFMQGHRGQIHVAALPSLSVALLPDAIARFRQRHPQVEFTLLELPAQALLSAVEQGRADFGLCVQPAPDQRLTYRRLRSDPMVLLCREDDPLRTRPNVPWSICGERPYLTVQSGSSIRQIVDAVFMRKRLAIRPALEAPSVATCCALVNAGVGITALPQLSLRLTDMRGLAMVPLVQPAVSRSVGIVTRIGRSISPAASGFIGMLTGERQPR